MRIKDRTYDITADPCSHVRAPNGHSSDVSVWIVLLLFLSAHFAGWSIVWTRRRSRPAFSRTNALQIAAALLAASLASLAVSLVLIAH